MCMKYLNATTCCYESVTLKGEKPISFNRPFNRIIATKQVDGTFAISGFSIVTQMSLLGTNTEANKAVNIIEQQGCIDVIIRLTKCDVDAEKQLARDLDIFKINIKEMSNQIDRACYSFLNYTRITEISDVKLDAGIGNYVIKVLVKNEVDDNYTIQTMSSFQIIE